MDSQTNFYHYTLQVKKRSQGRSVYGPFNFYVVSAGSSIIAQPGATVHRGPDEMLSWHGYQSAQAAWALCPTQRKGACAAAAGVPFLSSSSLAAANSRPPFVTGMVHLEVGVFVSGGLHSCWFPLLHFILLFSSSSDLMLRRTPCVHDKLVVIAWTGGRTKGGDDPTWWRSPVQWYLGAEPPGKHKVFLFTGNILHQGRRQQIMLHRI